MGSNPRGENPLTPTPTRADVDLRERMVDTLLRALRPRPGTHGHDDQPTVIAPPTDTLLARCRRAQYALQPGTPLDGMTIAAQVHEGRFSALYRARGDSGQELLVRLLHADQKTNPVALACLRRDAHLADAIASGAVLPVRRQGVTDDGRAYLARDWVSGESLAALLARRRLEPLRALVLLRSLCRAVSELHAAGVTHRNLHPAVILLERVVPRRIRLIGLDVALGPTDDRFLPELANPGLFAAGHRAPELARGEPSDTRGDVYSLGVIAYQLLLGERPFDPADDPLRGRTLRPPRTLAPELAPEVDVLIELMLADEPRHRPTLATAFGVLTDAAWELAAAAKEAERRGLAVLQQPLDFGREVDLTELDRTVDDAATG